MSTLWYLRWSDRFSLESLDNQVTAMQLHSVRSELSSHSRSVCDSYYAWNILLVAATLSCCVAGSTARSSMVYSSWQIR